ncbi:MAG TPA: DinB family protein [Candidatus Dormibacteraeota bacterium]|nr:DinB family protein [Candidatus Dormibacteraeota bacterium]
MSRLALLAATMDDAYARLNARLDGLSDEEFFWQPVPNSWTIFEDRPGNWTYDYEIPDPHPAPATTIGWQVVHLGTTRLMYHEWAYGPAKLTFPAIEVPHDVEGAMKLLSSGFELLREDLRHETEDGLDQPRKTNWGDLWPAWRIFTAMTDHDALHGGAIGALRDLYYWTTRS